MPSKFIVQQSNEVQENLILRMRIATIRLLLSVFSAAGPIPYIRQFICQLCQFACWLLSDKNLNALKTSRYKTFPSRLKETLGLFMFLYT